MSKREMPEELEGKEKECDRLMKECPGGRFCVNWPSKCFNCFRHPNNDDFLSESQKGE